MKIVELITFLAGGGAERFVVDLSNQLAKENETYLVTILDDKKETEVRNFFRSEISDSVHYVNLGFRMASSCLVSGGYILLSKHSILM